MKRTIFAATIISLFAGCAPELVIPQNELLTTVGDADLKRCEEFAQAQSAAVEGKPVAGLVFMGVLFTSPVSAVLSIGGQPGFLLPYMFFKAASDRARENRETRQRIHEEALKNCLEPTETPQQALRPENTKLAEERGTAEHNEGQ